MRHFLFDNESHHCSVRNAVLFHARVLNLVSSLRPSQCLTRTRDNNTMHTEPQVAWLFLLASRSPRPGDRCRYHFSYSLRMVGCSISAVRARDMLVRRDSSLARCPFWFVTCSPVILAKRLHPTVVAARIACRASLRLCRPLASMSRTRTGISRDWNRDGRACHEPGAALVEHPTILNEHEK